MQNFYIRVGPGGLKQALQAYAKAYSEEVYPELKRRKQPVTRGQRRRKQEVRGIKKERRRAMRQREALAHDETKPT